MYRREALHLMIYTFIDAYKYIHPSVTIQEAASAFTKRYKISEDEYSVNTVVAIHGRVQQDLIDAERFQNEQQRQKNNQKAK